MVSAAMRFEFATATRLVFGPGVLAEAAPAARAMGARALVVLGAHVERSEPLLSALAGAGVPVTHFSVEGEPDLACIRRGVALAQDAACDLLIGCGGGSVIDAAKAIAALVANGGDPLDYLEVVGQARALQRPSLPCIAIPTTAGTGSEVTRNAVLAVPEQRIKVSLRSPHLLPRLALVDPLLTHSLPPHVTASTGLDALTQLIEPFVSSRANPLADALCREGLARAARSLRRAYTHGDDAAARQDMALASLLGGLALANAGLGAVHGIASVVGGMFAAPHGAVCARLLTSVMSINLRALQRRQPQSTTMARYTEIARIVTGAATSGADDGIAWVQALCRDLAIPPLSAYGLSAADLPAIVEKSLFASSSKANPMTLTAEEMTEAVARAL